MEQFIVRCTSSALFLPVVKLGSSHNGLHYGSEPNFFHTPTSVIYSTQIKSLFWNNCRFRWFYKIINYYFFLHVRDWSTVLFAIKLKINSFRFRIQIWNNWVEMGEGNVFSQNISYIQIKLHTIFIKIVQWLIWLLRAWALIEICQHLLPWKYGSL